MRRVQHQVGGPHAAVFGSLPQMFPRLPARFTGGWRRATHLSLLAPTGSNFLTVNSCVSQIFGDVFVVFCSGAGLKAP